MTARIEYRPTDDYQGEYIPIDLWGRDHWSLLLYIESRQVDGLPLKMAFDPHMRQNRRHFRVLVGGDHYRAEIGMPMEREYGSRLNNNEYAVNHDDWCCVQDFAAADLLNIQADDLDVGSEFRFNQNGIDLAARLRSHKANGGSFSNFTYRE